MTPGPGPISSTSSPSSTPCNAQGSNSLSTPAAPPPGPTHLPMEPVHGFLLSPPRRDSGPRPAKAEPARVTTRAGAAGTPYLAMRR